MGMRDRGVGGEQAAATATRPARDVIRSCLRRHDAPHSQLHLNDSLSHVPWPLHGGVPGQAVGFLAALLLLAFDCVADFVEDVDLELVAGALAPLVRGGAFRLVGGASTCCSCRAASVSDAAHAMAAATTTSASAPPLRIVFSYETREPAAGAAARRQSPQAR